MKLAITCQGTTLDDPIDPRFGRGRYFLVVDSETDQAEAVDNTQNVNAVQGAGIQATENVSRLGVEAIVTGHCGPKAFRALQAAGVKIYVGAQGTAREALEAFKAGTLKTADRPDVEGHWA